MNPLKRYIILLEAENAEIAVKLFAEQYKPIDASTLTLIDTTKDFNQNKWLGLELSNTLIYFDDRTPINGLLSILGCVRGGCCLIFAYHPKKALDNFKQSVFLPTLAKLIKEQQPYDYPNASANELQTATMQISTPLTTSVTAPITTAITTPITTPITTATTTQINVPECSELQQYLRHSVAQVIHIIGERGTGKSTLLGQFIGQYSKQYPQQRIVLCSPSRASSANTLRFLDDVSRETFIYTPPSELLSAVATADVVIVDEASAINRGLIQKLRERLLEQRRKQWQKQQQEQQKNYSQEKQQRLIFATTLDGYEGTGQSYRLSYINSDKVIRLTEPKRYAKNDPLYQWVQEICHYQHTAIVADDGLILADNTKMREQSWLMPCFALLRQAHYRSSPNDLARFYNDKATFGLIVKQQRVVAAVYALSECLPDVSLAENQQLVTAIYQGRRRIKNAFTQQAIINAYGDNDKQAATIRVLRISRIATEQVYRRQGQATKLIEALSNNADRVGDTAVNRSANQTGTDDMMTQGYDFLSTSFGLREDNLAFWLKQGFIPVRLGINRNKWHDEYAVLMLKPLHEKAYKQALYWQQQFARHFHYYFPAYQAHHAAIAEQIQTRLKDIDWQTNITVTTAELLASIDSVINHHRDVHWLLPILNKYINENHQALESQWLNKIKPYLNGYFLAGDDKISFLKELQYYYENIKNIKSG